MTYQNVWWYPNYIEYGTGLNCPKTWPKVHQQYQRPNPHTDLRYYDLPTEHEERLYYRLPRTGRPAYRGTFRDKPHTVTPHYPDICPIAGKPDGFHGRIYKEDGPPRFKYEGPKKDDLYWLERNPYLPIMDDRRMLATRRMFESIRGINPPDPRNYVIMANPDTIHCGCKNGVPAVVPSGSPYDSSLIRNPGQPDIMKRQTVDGVGYL